MNVLWGLATLTIGVSFMYCGSVESDFAVYRLLCARSRLLWGDRVHRFYQAVGATLSLLGLLWATGVIW